MIKKEHKLSVILLFFVFGYLAIDTVVFSQVRKENEQLKQIIESNLETTNFLIMQLNSCVDILEAYKEVDLYAHPD